MPQKYCGKFEPPEYGARALQTNRPQTDGRQHIANVNVSSRSLKIEPLLLQPMWLQLVRCSSMICISDSDKYVASFSTLLEHLWLMELELMSWSEPANRKNFPAPLTIVASMQLFTASARYVRLPQQPPYNNRLFKLSTTDYFNASGYKTFLF